MRTAGERVTRELCETIECTTAEALLSALSPHIGEDLWDRPDQGSWLFRGQAESVWTLRPSAMRPDAFLNLIPGQVVMPKYTPGERRGLEAAKVHEFASLASSFGFEVPGDAQHLRDRDYAGEDDGSDFPPMDQRGIYALAQHYGVPTRLLDWTRRPLFAAYFAARDAVDPTRRPCPESDGRLAVWTVQHGFVDQVCRAWDPGAVVITAPTVSNPNLHAQMGVFTLVRFKEAPKPEDEVPDLDALLIDDRNRERARAVKGLPKLPMLFKFTMPHGEAPKLLHYLDLHFVNAASAFPGRHSIFAYMREGKVRAVCRPPTT